MKNYEVYGKIVKNPIAAQLREKDFKIRVNYGTHSRIFNSIDEYEPSPGEIAALEEYNKRNKIITGDDIKEVEPDEIDKQMMYEMENDPECNEFDD